MDSQEKILLAIKADEKQRGSVLEQYRQALIEMKKRYFSQREMAEMLNQGGVKISQQAVSNYLRKRPITMEELNDKNVNLNQWKKQKTVKKSRSKKPVFFDISKPFK